jgi:hypothetical protein
LVDRKILPKISAYGLAVIFQLPQRVFRYENFHRRQLRICTAVGGDSAVGPKFKDGDSSVAPACRYGMLALALCDVKINGIYYASVVAMDYSSESAVKISHFKIQMFNSNFRE